MKWKLECSKQCHLKITATHSASPTLRHLEREEEEENMGKYTRKAKTTAAVAPTSCLGVSTRARTLALQHLGANSDALPPPSKPDACYLELRSRRLEKRMQGQSSTDAPRGCGCGGGGDASTEEFVRQGSISESIEGEGLGIEASFGGNHLDCEFVAAERITREGTPSSSIKVANIITALGSTTKQTCSPPAGQTRDALAINAPSANELEEFFTHAEELLHCHYVDKYNFEFSKGLPFPGRYEWTAVGS